MTIRCSCSLVRNYFVVIAALDSTRRTWPGQMVERKRIKPLYRRLYFRK